MYNDKNRFCDIFFKQIQIIHIYNKIYYFVRLKNIPFYGVRKNWITE